MYIFYIFLKNIRKSYIFLVFEKVVKKRNIFLFKETIALMWEKMYNFW